MKNDIFNTITVKVAEPENFSTAAISIKMNTKSDSYYSFPPFPQANAGIVH